MQACREALAPVERDEPIPPHARLWCTDCGAAYDVAELQRGGYCPKCGSSLL